VYTTKRTNTEKTNSDGGGQAMHEKSRDMQNERVMRMDKRNDQRKLQSRKPCSKATRHYKSRDAVEAKKQFFSTQIMKKQHSLFFQKKGSIAGVYGKSTALFLSCLAKKLVDIRATPGSHSGSTSACLWPWSEGTPPAYWPVCKFDLI